MSKKDLIARLEGLCEKAEKQLEEQRQILEKLREERYKKPYRLLKGRG